MIVSIKPGLKDKSCSSIFRRMKPSSLKKVLMGMGITVTTLILAFIRHFNDILGFINNFDARGIDILKPIRESDLIIILLLTSIVCLFAAYLKARKGQNTEKPFQSRSSINDSIIDLLDRSMGLKQYNYVVQLGTLLRRAPFLKSNNELRIKIGQTLLVAYREVKDRNNEAATLIEDIGNTFLENDNVEAAIQNIQHGINVINKQCEKLPLNSDALDDALYILIRGHRNLANCYSYRASKDSSNKETYKTHATNELKIADDLIASIHSDEKKLPIEGDLLYARNKLDQITDNWDDAISHVKKSIEKYNKLCDSFPSAENERKRNNSTTKNYRELGILYLAKKDYQNACDSLLLGLEHADLTKDYENRVLVNLTFCKAEATFNPAGEEAKHYFQQATQDLPLVDSKKVHTEYEAVKQEFGSLFKKSRK